MSAKTQFLQKLQHTSSRGHSCTDKGQADIAAFRRCLDELQETIRVWLTDTGIQLTESHCSLTDMLIGNTAFTLPCFGLHFDSRAVKFTPAFLYGQGVTGCVEVTLVATGQVSGLGRLFMRSAESSDWTITLTSKSGGQRKVFGEDAFFTLITPLVS